jgi:hypothetical protein
MKKELNYTSPEVSEAMYKLGIRWKASAYWQFVPGGKYYILKDKLEPFKKGFPAYNMTELGHMIPFGFFNKMKIHKYLNGYFKLQTREKKWKTYTSEAEARGRYLIDLFESGNLVIEDSKQNPQPQQ